MVRRSGPLTVRKEAQCRETRGNSKYAKEYLMIADLMELHFKED